MPDQVVQSVYYESPGPGNTERTLELALERARALGINDIVVPTTKGTTGVRACEVFQGFNVVVVSHSVGFSAPNTWNVLPENAERIRELGGHIVTATHALGGVGRAVRRKLSTYQVDEIIAFTLRNFSQGIKVCCEITIMAADAGLIQAGKEVMVMGGTGRGVDTAAVILAAHAQDFYDLRVVEILCKPRIAP
jgi:hypothetical protein